MHNSIAISRALSKLILRAQSVLCCRYFQTIAGDAVSSDEPVQVQYFIRHTSEITGLSWTHAGDGLLVSGKAGEVAMQEVPSVEAHPRLSKPRRLPSDIFHIQF